MASKWVGFDEDAMLEFDAVMDGRTTEKCASLNGTRLPKSHPFWNTYYPPNHFNCRSTVRQVYSGKATAADNIPSANIPPMFKVNLAKEQLAFPPDSAYYEGLPNYIVGFSNKLLLQNMQKEVIDKLCNKVEIIRDELHSPISFNERGIKEAFNQPHKFKESKNAALNDIDKILKTAHYEGFVEKAHLPKKHQKNTMPIGSHIFKTLIENEPTYLIVREYKDGIRFYSLSDNEKVILGINKKNRE